MTRRKVLEIDWFVKQTSATKFRIVTLGLAVLLVGISVGIMLSYSPPSEPGVGTESPTEAPSSSAVSPIGYCSRADWISATEESLKPSSVLVEISDSTENLRSCSIFLTLSVLSDSVQDSATLYVDVHGRSLESLEAGDGESTDTGCEYFEDLDHLSVRDDSIDIGLMNGQTICAWEPSYPTFEMGIYWIVNDGWALVVETYIDRDVQSGLDDSDLDDIQASLQESFSSSILPSLSGE